MQTIVVMSLLFVCLSPLLSKVILLCSPVREWHSFLKVRDGRKRWLLKSMCWWLANGSQDVMAVHWCAQIQRKCLCSFEKREERTLVCSFVDHRALLFAFFFFKFLLPNELCCFAGAVDLCRTPCCLFESARGLLRPRTEMPIFILWQKTIGESLFAGVPTPRLLTHELR